MRRKIAWAQPTPREAWAQSPRHVGPRRVGCCRLRSIWSHEVSLAWRCSAAHGHLSPRGRFPGHRGSLSVTLWDKCALFIRTKSKILKVSSQKESPEYDLLLGLLTSIPIPGGHRSPDCSGQEHLGCLECPSCSFQLAWTVTLQGPQALSLQGAGLWLSAAVLDHIGLKAAGAGSW